MIEKINSIKIKEIDKWACSDLNFKNDLPVIKFEIKGNGIGHEEQTDTRSTKEALNDFIEWLKEQQKYASLYLSKYDEIEKTNKVKFKEGYYSVL